MRVSSNVHGLFSQCKSIDPDLMKNVNTNNAWSSPGLSYNVHIVKEKYFISSIPVPPTPRTFEFFFFLHISFYLSS